MISLFKKKAPVKIFVCSLPKAGTHLVMSCLEKFSGLSYGGICLDNTLSFDSSNLSAENEDAVTVGVDDPHRIKSSVITEILRKIKKGKFIAAHVPYTSRMDQLLTDHEFKNIVIVRDPRDVVASHVPFILKTEEHYLHQRYSTTDNFDKNLMCSIEGFEDQSLGLKLESIRSRVDGMYGWSESDSALMVHFEDLIGGQGGGQGGQQISVIAKIAAHINYPLNDKELQNIAAKTFGGSYTFRKGSIGGWREVFNEDHKSRFKELAGDLLIDLGYEQNMDW